MTMLTRRDWWIGLALVVAGLLAHAAFPRYEFILTAQLGPRAIARCDRWTGAVEMQTDHGWHEVYHPRDVATAPDAATPATPAPKTHIGAYTADDVVPESVR